MMHFNLHNVRFGVEIKPPTLHAECKGLTQVLAILNGHTGIVRLFDRTTQELIFDGTVDELRESLSSSEFQQARSNVENFGTAILGQ